MDTDSGKAPRAGRRIRLGDVLRNTWKPLIVVLVVLLAAVSVWHARGMFTTPTNTPAPNAVAMNTVSFNPKHVTYELFGDSPITGSLSYLDNDGDPVLINLTTLPWTRTLVTTKTSAVASIMAQTDGNTLGCRIRVNGLVRDEHVSSGVHAAVSCTVLSG